MVIEPGQLSDRGRRARASLAGLSVADALGERFFGHPADVVPRIEARVLPAGEWRWTDDTLMACSVVETLAAGEPLDRALLFRSFVSRFEEGRGYGAAARDLLGDARRGLATMETAGMLFGGAGSFGNGAAMRAGPLGAWHGDEELAVVAAAADASATVTHTHAEARAGTIAVAVAAALAWKTRATRLTSAEFLAEVAAATPRSGVWERIDRAVGIPASVASERATRLLEVGMEASALDTVPFALWCAACSLDDFEEMFWRCVRGLGDRDTTCAMAGSVVASRLGAEGIPGEWLQRREPLPDWFEAGVVSVGATTARPTRMRQIDDRRGRPVAPALVGVVGDVHGCDGELAAVLAFLSDLRVGAVWCVGDVADGPGDIDACIALLVEHHVVTVRGNHDRWLLEDGPVRREPGEHSRASMSASGLEFLEQLPQALTFRSHAGLDVVLCHGLGMHDMNTIGPDDYGYGLEVDDDLQALLADGRSRLVIKGHSHRYALWQLDQLTLVDVGTLLPDSSVCGAVLELTDTPNVRFLLRRDDSFELSQPLAVPGPPRAPADVPHPPAGS